jgi:ABC-type sugar transport system ATPase subunit
VRLALAGQPHHKVLGVAAGEVDALAGQNGPGKSALIRVLAGYHEPGRGEVHVDGAKIDLGSPR